MKTMKKLIFNKMFLACCLTLTGIQYVVTGVQYWVPDYLTTIIGEDPAIVAWYFSFVCATSPVSGVIVGGFVMHKLGGYETKNSAYALGLMGALCAACAIPIPWCNGFYGIAVLIWFLLFFGGFIMPPMTGIMLSSVSAFERSQAMSTATLIYNLCGYLPGPIVYGFISTQTNLHGGSPRLAMGALLYTAIPIFMFQTCGLKKSLKRIRKRRMRDRRSSSLAMLSQASYI